MKIKKLTIILSMSLFIFGCGKKAPEITRKNICTLYPDACTDLHSDDSWCGDQKFAIAKRRVEFNGKDLKDVPPKDVYNLLIDLKNYTTCMERAINLQNIVNTEKTRDKQQAFGLSNGSLEELEAATKDNPDLWISFYQWTELQNTNAFNRIKKAYEEDKITEPIILGALGSYYLKSKPQKSEVLYFKALELCDKTTFDPDWLLALAQVYRTEQNDKAAYVLYLIYTKLTQTALNENQLKSIDYLKNIVQNEDEEKKLSKDADNIVKNIIKENINVNDIKKELDAYGKTTKK